jgi:hypothetical protein
MVGKTVYVILSPNWSEHSYIIYDSFPAVPNLLNLKSCDFAQIEKTIEEIPEEIVEYSKYVESSSFFINGVNSEYLWEYLTSHTYPSIERYPFSSQIADMHVNWLYKMVNVSGQTIGIAIRFYLLDAKQTELHKTGILVFLPPSTKITSSDAIEVLVNSLIGQNIKEEPPDWIKRINLPHVAELDQQISEKLKIIEEANKEIKQLEIDKTEIENHKELLWVNDKPLENAVRDAFLLLGFGEIRPGRSKELEDLVIDFKTSKEFVHGVFEVKGREKKTSMADMNQCDKWVKEYFVTENKNVKGIFVPSQFRRTETEDSKMRLKFEPNEIEFAKRFNLCVLPTVELFKAVVHVLKGNQLPREEIERKILEAKPICKLVD